MNKERTYNQESSPLEEMAVCANKQGPQERAEDKEEVTQDMIEAGLNEFRLFHPDFDSASELLRSVFVSMLRKRPPKGEHF